LYIKIPIYFIIVAFGFAATLSSCKQESVLFYPEKLPLDYKFTFSEKFIEYKIQVDKVTRISGLLFTCDSSKGLVFYLHGNGGSLDSWGRIARIYLENNYDFFILDYRGYGKSEGEITSEKQIYNDIQIAYDTMISSYPENKIVIIGYSIGTGPATELASVNMPAHLILQAPYFNVTDLAHNYMSSVPASFIRYKFRTDDYITRVNCPVTIFHGNQDEVIYTGSSLKLKQLFKPGDTLIILDGQSHNGINENEVYRKYLKVILQRP